MRGGEIGMKYKKIGSGRIETAGDFSVIADILRNDLRMIIMMIIMTSFDWISGKFCSYLHLFIY